MALIIVLARKIWHRYSLADEAPREPTKGSFGCLELFPIRGRFGAIIYQENS